MYQRHDDLHCWETPWERSCSSSFYLAYLPCCGSFTSTPGKHKQRQIVSYSMFLPLGPSEQTLKTHFMILLPLSCISELFPGFSIMIKPFKAGALRCSYGSLCVNNKVMKMCFSLCLYVSNSTARQSKHDSLAFNIAPLRDIWWVIDQRSDALCTVHYAGTPPWCAVMW